MKNCILWEGHHTRAGKERYNEGTTETCYGLTETPVPHPSALLKQEGGKEVEVEAQPRNQVIGAKCFNLVLILTILIFFNCQ